MKYTNAGGAEKETFVWKTMPPRKVVEEWMNLTRFYVCRKKLYN